MSKKWRLHHGIHRGTITSRDATSQEFDSKEEALAFLQKQKKFYRRIGYKTWFAELDDPEGKKTYLEGNTDYQ